MSRVGWRRRRCRSAVALWGMAIAGLKEEELDSLPGSDAREVAIARVIWERTTVSMKWLADHLHLRSVANAKQQIRRHRQCPPALPKAIRKWMPLLENVARPECRL
jgi:hypothetical protein